jgi:hypothetical protein
MVRSDPFMTLHVKIGKLNAILKPVKQLVESYPLCTEKLLEIKL